MSWLGEKYLCKHQRKRADCPICRVRAKPLDKKTAADVRKILSQYETKPTKFVPRSSVLSIRR